MQPIFDHGATYDFFRVTLVFNLTAVFGGQLGEPMGALAPLVGEILGAGLSTSEFSWAA